MRRQRYPSDVSLVHDGRRWMLTFGAYRLVVRACSCDLPPCTCKRAPAQTWARPESHERRHCHAGHPEHVAILFRRAVRTVRA
jgi:hypothetical protein